MAGEGTSEALLSFIGSQAMSARSDLQDFLREDLGAAALADRLDAAVQALRGRDGVAKLRTFQVAVAGWAAMWALLAGVVLAAVDAATVVARLNSSSDYVPPEVRS